MSTTQPKTYTVLVPRGTKVGARVRISGLWFEIDILLGVREIDEDMPSYVYGVQTGDEGTRGLLAQGRMVGEEP